jgi:hypothetical protein
MNVTRAEEVRLDRFRIAVDEQYRHGGGGGGGGAAGEATSGNERGDTTHYKHPKRERKAAAHPITAPPAFVTIGQKKVFTMNNYFSIGVDAEATLRFHSKVNQIALVFVQAYTFFIRCNRIGFLHRSTFFFVNFNFIKREESPGLFSSPTVNRAWYVNMSFATWVRSPEALAHRIAVEVDGVRLDLGDLQGVIVANLRSYAGGVDLWGEHTAEDDAKYVKVSAERAPRTYKLVCVHCFLIVLRAPKKKNHELAANR